MPCYSPLKGWKDRETGGIKFRRDNSTEAMEVACGQCLGCRLDRSRMWAMRIVHESCLHEDARGNCFVTLTYRSLHECDHIQAEKKFYVPDDWSLHRKHFVDFMKRLRKACEPDLIRYYMSGEYGSNCKHGIDLALVKCPLCNVGRPHFHACLFNCTFSDLVAYGSTNGETRFTSPFLEKTWGYGFVDVSDLTFQSAAYVARYIMKKVTGLNADDHYLSCDIDGVITFLEPEYCTMSRGREKPGGIGAGWFEKYGADVFPSDEVPVPGVGVLKGVPRYYGNLYADLTPEGMEEVKMLREVFMNAHRDEYTPERLMMKYKVKKAQVSMLKRSL